MVTSVNFPTAKSTANRGTSAPVQRVVTFRNHTTFSKYLLPMGSITMKFSESWSAGHLQFSSIEVLRLELPRKS